MATSRERLQATLEHRQPDRVCLDIGGTVTGVAASAMHAIERALLGRDGYRVMVRNPYWMTGDLDEPLRQALGADVVAIRGTGYSFPNPNVGWTPRDLFDGTPVIFPDDIAVTTDANGDWLIHPLKDPSLPPSHRMPKGGLYFDGIYRQDPVDEDALRPEDNTEEFVLLSDEIVGWVASQARRLHDETTYGILLELPGASLGGVGGLNGRTLAHPRGIRSPEEWYLCLAVRQDFVRAVFERQTEIAIANIERLAAVVGGIAQVALVSGTDFGTQMGSLISTRMYRELFSPYYRMMNEAIHRSTQWKTLIHSCGSNRELLPLMIEDGFDAFNPVQTSAVDMDPLVLKREFGSDLVFYGGGADTQATLSLGTPEEVYAEVSDRIAVFNQGGGYVFCPTQSIEAGTPVENITAMLKAIRDSYEA